MGLVEYSDSDSEDEKPGPETHRETDQGSSSDLPPLPSTFHDLYSSTVRTSTKDEPSLHGGRKRVTPHVEGNWPTHVYLEWHPSPGEYQLLSELIREEASKASPANGSTSHDVHSSLESDLGVPLPLHISLSRTLLLKAEQKESFLRQIKDAIASAGARVFDTRPEGLSWHPNEVMSRWFLVLRLQESTTTEMKKLLSACNSVALEFNQPLLYQESTTMPGEANENKFHISIAWALSQEVSSKAETNLTPAAGLNSTKSNLSNLAIPFSAIKVRIGQDVTTIALPSKRKHQEAFQATVRKESTGDIQSEKP